MSHDVPHDKDRPDDEPAAAGGDPQSADGSGVSGSPTRNDTPADSAETDAATATSGKKTPADDPGRGENSELWTNPRGSAGWMMRRWERRRQKVRDEIERNRRGEYKVPTWVLVIALVAVILGWIALIFWV